MSSLLIFAAILLVSQAVCLTTLVWSARWLNLRNPTWRRGLIVLLLWLAISIVALLIRLNTPANVSLPVSLALFVATILTEWAVLSRVMVGTNGRTAGVWGIVFAAKCSLLVVVVVGVRGYLLQSFLMPSNSMLPTVRGEHQVGICPKCGGPLVLAVPPFRPDPWADQKPTYGFCEQCHQLIDISQMDVAAWTSILNKSSPKTEGDRFLISKFLQPHRWDLVAFHHEQEIYCKRLVGMPGDLVLLDWNWHFMINAADPGTPPDMPWWNMDYLKELRHIPGAMQTGAQLKLGPDEFFVVGDDPNHSLDSRYSAPVQRKDIVGVVTLIYWPLDRIRVFR